MISIALFSFLPNYIAFTLIAALAFSLFSITLCCLKKHIAFKTDEDSKAYTLRIIGGFCISLISIIVLIAS